MKEYLGLRFAGENAELKALIFDDQENPSFGDRGAGSSWLAETEVGRLRSVLALTGHEGARDFANGDDLTQCPFGDRHFPRLFLTIC